MFSDANNINNLFESQIHQLEEGRKTSNFEVPSSFQQALCQWTGYLCELGHHHLNDTILKNRHAAPLVQVLLLAIYFDGKYRSEKLRANDQKQIQEENKDTSKNESITFENMSANVLKRLCCTILPLEVAADIAAAPARFCFLARHEHGSRIAEIFLKCCSDSIFDSIHKHVLQDECLTLASHPISNFVVQKYLHCIRNAHQVRQTIASFIPNNRKSSQKSSNEGNEKFLVQSANFDSICSLVCWLPLYYRIISGKIYN